MKFEKKNEILLIFDHFFKSWFNQLKKVLSSKIWYIPKNIGFFTRFLCKKICFLILRKKCFWPLFLKMFPLCGGWDFEIWPKNLNRRLRIWTSGWESRPAVEISTGGWAQPAVEILSTNLNRRLRPGWDSGWDWFDSK